MPTLLSITVLTWMKRPSKSLKCLLWCTCKKKLIWRDFAAERFPLRKRFFSVSSTTEATVQFPCGSSQKITARNFNETEFHGRVFLRKSLKCPRTSFSIQHATLFVDTFIFTISLKYCENYICQCFLYLIHQFYVQSGKYKR